MSASMFDFILIDVRPIKSFIQNSKFYNIMIELYINLVIMLPLIYL